MFPKSSLLSITALSLLLSSLTAVAADPAKPGLITAPDFSKLAMNKLTSPRTLLTSFAIASAYNLYSRPSVTEDKWQSRFSWDMLKDVSKVGSKAYWKNIWHLYQDEFIGQCHKSKAIKLDKDGEHRLQVHAGDCLPHGLCGRLDLSLKTFNRSVDSLSGLLVTYYLLNQSGFFGPLQQKINTASKDAPALPPVIS